MQIPIHLNPHVRLRTLIQIHIHTHTHAHAHTHTHTCTHACMHTCIHTYIYIQTIVHDICIHTSFVIRSYPLSSRKLSQSPLLGTNHLYWCPSLSFQSRGQSQQRHYRVHAPSSNNSCVHTCTISFLCAWASVCLCTTLSVQHPDVRTYTCMHACMHACKCIPTYTHTQINIHT